MLSNARERELGIVLEKVENLAVDPVQVLASLSRVLPPATGAKGR